MENISLSRKILGAMPLLLVAIGTIANLLTVGVCMRKNLRKKSTFVFLAFIAIADTIPLYFYTLSSFTVTYFGLFIDEINEFFCRSCVFFYASGNYISAWLLVIMSLERYAKVDLSIWKKVNFDGKKACILSSMMVIFIIVAFIPSFYATEYVSMNITIDNQTRERYFCPRGYIYDVYGYIQLWAYSIIPFVLITIANLLLVKTILFVKSKHIQRSVEQIKKRRSTSVSIMIITIGFILFTLPNGIIIGFFLNQLATSHAVLVSLQTFTFLNDAFHCSSFFIFLASNTLFRKEFKSIIFRNYAYAENSETNKTKKSTSKTV